MDCIVVTGPETCTGFRLCEIERALDALVAFVPTHFNGRLEHIAVLGHRGVALRAWEWASVSSISVTTLAPPFQEHVAFFQPLAIAVLPGSDPDAVRNASIFASPVLVWQQNTWKSRQAWLREGRTFR